MEKRYISVCAQSKKESEELQKALFIMGFEWLFSGKQIQKHTNFYARFYDMKIITCYHDPLIDNESLRLHYPLG